MSKREITFNPGECYHIYNRGHDGQNIFYKHNNYLYLLQKVNKFSVICHIDVIAYCLMPNHYHFLLCQGGDITISKFMYSIFNGYSKAFNKMYNRKGTLFQGRFQSKLVDENSYLIHLTRYIHRNPVDREKPLVDRLEDWPYSNYLEWTGKRQEKLFNDMWLHDYFQSPSDYQKFVLDYVPNK